MQNAVSSFILSKRADGRAPRTIQDYHRCLGPFAVWCNEHSLSLGNLTRQDVRRYVVKLRANKWSEATVGIHIRNLRTFWRWCHDEGLTEHNLALAISAPKTHRRNELPLSPRDIQTLLSACDSDDKQAVRDKAMILFLTDTGLRVGEMELIARANVHINVRGWVRVYGSKTGQRRFVILGERTCRALSKYLNGRDDELSALWVGRQGALTDRGIYHALKRRARMVGMEERVHPHIFRKSFATQWLDNGGDAERLRVLMGWSPETLSQMMAIYVASKRDHLEAAHRKAGPVDNMAW